MVMAAAALCLTVAGAAACTIGAFFVSQVCTFRSRESPQHFPPITNRVTQQEGCGRPIGPGAAAAAGEEGREGLVHIPLHHRRSSSSFGSSSTMPPPPSPEAASDREVPPDV